MSSNQKQFMYLHLWSDLLSFTSWAELCQEELLKFFLKANNFFFNLLGITWAQLAGEGLQNQ